MGLYDDTTGYLSPAERARQEAAQSRRSRRSERRQLKDASSQQSVFGSTEGGGLTAGIDQDENKAHSLFQADTPQSDLGENYGYDRIRLHKNEEVSVYAAETDARYAMDKRKRNTIILSVAVFLIAVVCIILPDTQYNEYHYTYSLPIFFEQLGTNIADIGSVFTGDFTNWMYFKICSYVVVAMAGAALAMSGACYQGSLKNSMASPSTLGVMSGGQMGSVIYILLGGSTTLYYGSITTDQLSSYLSGLDLLNYISTMYGSALCALAGSFIVVMLVLLLSFIAGRGKVSKAALIIAGTVFATVISSVIQLVRYWLIEYGTEEQVTALTNMATGTNSGIYTIESVLVMLVPIAICMFFIMRLRPRMNILSFDEDEARSMGVSVQRDRNIMIAVCTILTAVVVAFCGGIGYVGFLVPHIVRKMVGPDFRFLIPATAVCGAGFTVISNAVTNWAFNGLGMGSITAIIGTVVFIVMALNRRGQGSADWV